jgi:hypothetical protein
MAWTVILEDESKNIISSLDSEFSVPSTSIFIKLRLLRYLDPFGDTTFNHIQMDDLIKDLEEIKNVADDLLINKIQQLAISCKSNPHTYLTFYGD